MQALKWTLCIIAALAIMIAVPIAIPAIIVIFTIGSIANQSLK